MNKVIISLIVAFTVLVSCQKEPQKVVASLASETDSLAYIIGMNIADNLMAMDSTLNVAVVCRAIEERTSSKSLLSAEDARDYYLRYLTYVEPERRRGYEEQYLADLVKTNRGYTRSKSGLAYNITVIGDEDKTPRGANDLVSVLYTISRINGEVVYSSLEAGDTLVSGLKELHDGVQESLKMIGVGGKVDAWIPSKLAFDQAGDSLLRIAPFETLYYQFELLEMERNGAAKIQKNNRWE